MELRTINCENIHTRNYVNSGSKRKTRKFPQNRNRNQSNNQCSQTTQKRTSPNPFSHIRVETLYSIRLEARLCCRSKARKKSLSQNSRDKNCNRTARDSSPPLTEKGRKNAGKEAKQRKKREKQQQDADQWSVDE